MTWKVDCVILCKATEEQQGIGQGFWQFCTLQNNLSTQIYPAHHIYIFIYKMDPAHNLFWLRNISSCGWCCYFRLTTLFAAPTTRAERGDRHLVNKYALYVPKLLQRTSGTKQKKTTTTPMDGFSNNYASFMFHSAQKEREEISGFIQRVLDEQKECQEWVCAFSFLGDESLRLLTKGHMRLHLITDADSPPGSSTWKKSCQNDFHQPMLTLQSRNSRQPQGK